MSAPPSQEQINRVSRRAAAQQTGAAESLAGAAAYDALAGQYQFEGQGPEAAHPSTQRMAGPQWAGYTSQQNHAQRAQASEIPWVTVPADRIVVQESGSAHVTPVYATTHGYAEGHGESAGSIPPNFTRNP